MRLNLTSVEALMVLLGCAESMVAGVEESGGSEHSDSSGVLPVRMAQKVGRAGNAQVTVEMSTANDAEPLPEISGSSYVVAEPSADIPGYSYVTAEPLPEMSEYDSMVAEMFADIPGSGTMAAEPEVYGEHRDAPGGQSGQEALKSKKGELEGLLDEYRKMLGRRGVDRETLLRKVGGISACLEEVLGCMDSCPLLSNILCSNEILTEIGEGLRKEDVEMTMRLPIGILNVWLACDRYQEAVYSELEILSKSYTELVLSELMKRQVIMTNRLNSRLSKLRMYGRHPGGDKYVKRLLDLQKVESDTRIVMKIQRMRISILSTSRSFKNGQKKINPELNRAQRLAKFLEILRNPSLPGNWLINHGILERTRREVVDFLNAYRMRVGQGYDPDQWNAC